MKDTIVNHFIMQEVMTNLREQGARCCFLLRGEYPNGDKSIRAVLRDGRVWDIKDIKQIRGGNEAIVTCTIE